MSTSLKVARLGMVTRVVTSVPILLNVMLGKFIETLFCIGYHDSTEVQSY